MYSEFDAWKEGFRRKAQNEAEKWLIGQGMWLDPVHRQDHDVSREYTDVLRQFARKLAESNGNKQPGKDWARRILQDAANRPAIAVRMAHEALGQAYDHLGNIGKQPDLGQAEPISKLPSAVIEEEPLF
jgi:phosphate uptake regulator